MESTHYCFRQFSRGGDLLHMEFEECSGEIDQSLDKAGWIALRWMAFPKRLPNLVRFPEIEPVKEINAPKVGFERFPLIGCPGGMNLHADCTMAVSPWIANRMRVKSGNKTIRWKRAVFCIPWKELYLRRVWEGEKGRHL